MKRACASYLRNVELHERSTNSTSLSSQLSDYYILFVYPSTCSCLIPQLLYMCVCYAILSDPYYNAQLNYNYGVLSWREREKKKSRQYVITSWPVTRTRRALILV